ncbi:hypothetical protein EX30DRAFT_370046 [Ascodesmis nigricans]|uniref:Actin-like ATPase domain-containing protein n=1 Tax=Ascodesmis nigricans TaxID=341454 RepID=A0A4S2N1T1_9PEZI|nr:hypothetical protein EX30DRAFT_370046 [Ascodesmis nigricans]
MTTSLRSALLGLDLSPSRPVSAVSGLPTAKIVVGIDFGTTHSAVAWAQTDAAEEYEVITNWPGMSGNDFGKVPSDVSYGPITSAPNTPQTARSSTSSSGASDNYSDASRASSDGSWASMRVEDIARPNGILPKGFKWGFLVPPTSPDRISYIKILLDPLLPRPTFVSPSITTLPPGITPLQVASDYLLALRLHTLQTISRRLGPQVLAESEIEYILTVPAVWSDKARQLTLEAAIAAGLGAQQFNTFIPSPVATTATIRLLTEPEAAAEYTLRSLRTSAANLGDCFTVVDLGGATADLISYRITKLGPLRLEEVAVGTGALCGGVYLDRRFEDWVKGKVGQKYWDKMGAHARHCLKSYWESCVKREFCWDAEEEEKKEKEMELRRGMDAMGDVGIGIHGGSEMEDADPSDYWVPVVGVPDNPAMGIKDSFLRLTRREVYHLFQPITSQIQSLIASQLLTVLNTCQMPVSALLLVGGLGSSPHIDKQIKTWCTKIPVLQPRNAWTAVVRGAIIRGVSGSIGVEEVATPQIPQAPPSEAATSPTSNSPQNRFPKRTSSLSRPTNPSAQPSLGTPQFNHSRFRGSLIASRLARRWYGVVHDAVYNPAIHGDATTAQAGWHKLRREWVVKNRVRWYISRGDMIRDGVPISFPFYRTVSENQVSYDHLGDGTYVLKTELFVYDGDITDAGSGHHRHHHHRHHAQNLTIGASDGNGNVKQTAPEVRNEHVKRLCTLKTQPLPVRYFMKMRNDQGERFWRVDYELEVTIGEGGVGFEMVLLRRRKRRPGEVVPGEDAAGKGKGGLEVVVEEVMTPNGGVAVPGGDGRLRRREGETELEKEDREREERNKRKTKDYVLEKMRVGKVEARYD